MRNVSSHVPLAQAKSPSLWARLTYTFSELVFPPFCIWCDEKLPKNCRYFCASCWQFITPIDPINRCPHCFCESDTLCKKCSTAPTLSIARAAIFEKSPLTEKFFAQHDLSLFAPYYAYQWSCLNWPRPAQIAALPLEFAPSYLHPLAKAVARLFGLPLTFPFKTRYVSPFTYRLQMNTIPKLPLLLIDLNSSTTWQKQNVNRLIDAGIHSLYLLSLTESC